jgi:hypothetical protein
LPSNRSLNVQTYVVWGTGGDIRRHNIQVRWIVRNGSLFLPRNYFVGSVVVGKTRCHDARICRLAQMFASLDIYLGSVCKISHDNNTDRAPFGGPQKYIARMDSHC